VVVHVEHPSNGVGTGAGSPPTVRVTTLVDMNDKSVPAQSNAHVAPPTYKGGVFTPPVVSGGFTVPTTVTGPVTVNVQLTAPLDEIPSSNIASAPVFVNK
jgi:hypothetical protein